MIRRTPPKKTPTKNSRGRKAAAKPFPTLTQGQYGALLGTSQQRVSQLLKEGVITALPDGKIDAFVATPLYVRSIKRIPDENMSRIRQARAREIEMRVAREARELVPLAEMNEHVGHIFQTFRAELNGLPASCTRDLAHRAVIEKNLNDTIERTRLRLVAMEKALKAGEDFEDDDDIEEDE